MMTIDCRHAILFQIIRLTMKYSMILIGCTGVYFILGFLFFVSFPLKRV